MVTCHLSCGEQINCLMSAFLNGSITLNRFLSVLGLIRDNNKLAYIEAVKHLADWYDTNNLILNVNKTKEIVVDFRKKQPSHTPLLINGAGQQHQIPGGADHRLYLKHG